MVEGKIIWGGKREAAGRAWLELSRILRVLFHKIYRKTVKFTIGFYFVSYGLSLTKYCMLLYYMT